MQICTDKIDCDEAADGAQALKMVKDYGADNPYILVFMDLNMPVMDGFQSSKEIMEFTKATNCRVIPKIYGLTSYSKDELGVLLSENPNALLDCISKPFKMDDIKKIVSAHFAHFIK